ncbi:MAG: 5-(carboxyamino)imidazole ribonucleotide synthase [Bacteroidetes bacterium]|nr:5-(carboxyamino)imidazole ribonucleotide synthase [Bacteroidota bacterium]
MKSVFNPHYKIGILGGGQLGKMLALAASNWNVKTYVLDTSVSFPAARACTKFFEGNFKDYEDVYRFGKQVDVLTIEIEHVNTEALLQLKKEGVVIHPDPEKLEIIKDKGLQKQFYINNHLPTSTFRLYETDEDIRDAVRKRELTFPFVQKTRTAGYDGRGVVVIKNEETINQLIPAPSLVEPLVNIKKELAVIVAMNGRGEVQVFPPVEMEFHPEANLVEYLLCPANISFSTAEKAKKLAINTIKAFDICGLLAVELFLTNEDGLLINEVAPRTHNSGHHTIDSCYTSQFQQQLRAITNLPLGSTKMKTPSVMVNLLGKEGYSGAAVYEGINECLELEGVHLHIYGKTITKPFRKMGHATILGENLDEARKRAELVKQRLEIVSR